MFKLQRLEITGFKSFADYTELVFSGSGITAVVGPNGCGKSNVSDAISWVLGEQRAKSLRGGEMKDVVFQGTKNRKPGGAAEVVLHLIRDDTFFDIDQNELEDIDEALSGLDENAIDMSEIVPPDETATVDDQLVSEIDAGSNGFHDEFEVATVQAAAVGSTRVVDTKVKTKRHWRPRSFALEFAPGEAVSVTRRLYLSGESDYQLNGKTCRLRDITDLFAGTGLSGAHYAIIEQGRIGQILSAKPADRRSLIEEAAGISKFRARQRAAETRLESAKVNLSRIFDIVSEIETRVNSLRRQASKTRRFKILQEEFRDLLRRLYAAEGKYLSDLSEDLKRQLSVAEFNETELIKQVAAKEECAREATAAARAAEESLSELRGIHANNALERDRAEREHIYKSDQIVSLNTRCETLRGEVVNSQQRLTMLTSELERLKKDEQHESSEHADAESALRESEDAHREAAEALGEIEITVETIRAELMQHTAATERFDEIARQLDNNLTRLATRADELNKERDRAHETYSSNQKEADALAETLATEELKLVGLNNTKDQFFAATADARNARRAAESELSALNDEYSAKKHRLATLLELEEKRAVYTPQVQKIFAEEKNIGVRLAGVLADRLSVAREAETAVEALFGAFLEAIVVESLADAQRVSVWLKDNDLGRTAMIILPGGTTATKRSSRTGDTIADLLGVSSDLEKVLRQIFPREMSARLVPDFLTNEMSDGEILSNYEGDLLVGGRLFVGGNRASTGTNESLLAFKRELNHLDKDCARLAAVIEKTGTRVESARAALIESESKTVDLQSQIIKVDRGIHGLQIQVRSAREEIERTERHRKVVADESAQVNAEINDARAKLVAAVEGKQAAETARMEASASLERVSADLAQARVRIDAANAVLNEKRMVAATSDERRRSAVSALRRVENEVKEVESRIALQTLEIAEAEAKIESLHNSIDEITDRIASAGSEVDSENIELAAAVEGLTLARANSDRTSEDLAELNHRAGEARNGRAAIEIAQAEAVTELKNTAENCRQELNLPLASLVADAEPDADFVLETARHEAAELRLRLENFGAINMLALEELGEAEERHLFLTSQRQDIIDSIAATEEALREIKHRSREKFRAAFEAININFVEFFQELFGGGRGEMTLMESDDILEAGIEVVAQPPGKRLQNILLLSGGEKAMTAIALVMSIFKYRPSPFCLLDEVDAPLDDANVGRFVDKIAAMSERTQFIVITHNKRTMEAARALYGVTMQEAGVSKVVSVKFE
ncbi:MAG: chromosome segregation protein SMC [Pyrinomonadaceae bacterium]